MSNSRLVFRDSSRQRLAAYISASHSGGIQVIRELSRFPILRGFRSGKPTFTVGGNIDAKPITRGVRRLNVLWNQAGTNQGSHITIQTAVLLTMNHLRKCNSGQHVLYLVVVSINAGREKELLTSFLDHCLAFGIAQNPTAGHLYQCGLLELLFSSASLILIVTTAVSPLTTSLVICKFAGTF